MNRSHKLFWMFVPLAVGFLLLFVAMDDMKHPVVAEDDCTVIGTGPAVESLKTEENVLYRQSDTDVYDIALQCQGQGTVVINDMDPFQAAMVGGEAVHITSKSYHYLPTQWRVDVETGIEAPVEQ
jgi:hypothetical protein